MEKHCFDGLAKYQNCVCGGGEDFMNLWGQGVLKYRANKKADL